MGGFFSKLFDHSDFVPRTHCGVWTPELMWTLIFADGTIWVCYMAIPIALMYFAMRRGDLPFHWILWMFAAFIVSCGFTHFVDMLAFSMPMYRLAALVKVITAITSLSTVIALVRLVPRIIDAPALGQLISSVGIRASKRPADGGVHSAAGLERREQELETLIEMLPFPIAVAHDRECLRMSMNTACARLFAIPRTENPSKSAPGGEALPFRVLKDGRELRPDELPMQVASATGKSVKDLWVELEFADGRRLQLLESANPLFDERGRVRGCVGSFVNVSERPMPVQGS